MTNEEYTRRLAVILRHAASELEELADDVEDDTAPPDPPEPVPRRYADSGIFLGFM